MTPYTFTEQDFIDFRYEVTRWTSCLGLANGWFIEVRQEQIGGGVNAQCAYDVQRRNALFRLTIHTEGDFCMLTDPKKLALHECLHLALAEVVYTAAKLGDDSHELAIAKEHELINRLMMVMS